MTPFQSKIFSPKSRGISHAFFKVGAVFAFVGLFSLIVYLFSVSL